MSQTKLANASMKVQLKLHMKYGTKIPTSLLARASRAGVSAPGLREGMAKMGGYSSQAMKWAGSMSGGAILTVLTNVGLAAGEYESDEAVWGPKRAAQNFKERSNSYLGMTKGEVERMTMTISDGFAESLMGDSSINLFENELAAPVSE